jgi:hypothetical protein
MTFWAAERALAGAVFIMARALFATFFTRAIVFPLRLAIVARLGDFADFFIDDFFFVVDFFALALDLDLLDLDLVAAPRRFAVVFFDDFLPAFFAMEPPSR